jgi:GDP-D-mannose dehydratase
MAEEITGHSMEVRVNPQFVRQNEVPRLLGNPERLRTCIGYQPQTALREVLRWMLEVDA